MCRVARAGQVLTTPLSASYPQTTQPQQIPTTSSPAILVAGADEDMIDTDENVVDPQLSAKPHTGSSERDTPESTSAEKLSAGKGTGSGQGAIPKKKKMTK